MFDFDNFETVFTSKFSNFATEIAEGSLERHFDEYIDQVAGYRGWRLALMLKEDEGGDYVIPTFSWPEYSYDGILNVRILINPLNHLNPENEEFKYSDRFYFEMSSSIEGKKMYLSKILDDKNGWLNNGTFTVEIGFYVESLSDKHGLWRFNFLNDPFQLKSESDVVYLYRGDTDFCVMCHIQLIKLHCKDLHKKMNAENEIRGVPCFKNQRMKICLDILHGVRLKCKEKLYKKILKIAKTLEFSNVMRYIELQFIEDPSGNEDIGDRILFSIQSNFNRLLICLIEDLEELGVLKELLEKVDIGMMSGESMKICLKKLLYSPE